MGVLSRSTSGNPAERKFPGSELCRPFRFGCNGRTLAPKGLATERSRVSETGVAPELFLGRFDLGVLLDSEFGVAGNVGARHEIER